MKTFSQLATDAIAVLTRLGADKEPTRSQLLYAAKQALRRDGERNPPARLYLPLMQAIETQLAYDGIACAAEQGIAKEELKAAELCTMGCVAFIAADDLCDGCLAARKEVR